MSTHFPSATKTLRDVFGFDSFRDGQEAVIQCLLDGRSALAVFPTGGGKSMCYQLPALLLEGVTLVVSPLIALMKDQVEAMQRCGVAAARLDSSLGSEEVREVYEALSTGTIKLLYVAPERLANEGFKQRLKSLSIAMLAVDEAHCISEWGHNFRPDYLKLARLARTLKVPRVLTLTATATPEVSCDIRKAFRIRKTDHIQTGYYRPNLRFAVTPATAASRGDLLVERIKQGTLESTIVYVTLQRTADEVAAHLQAHGIEARAYHAGLKSETRHSLQEAFMSGVMPVVVATIAFGMGIDKADIRRVIHYNLPSSLENYVQETGRAGRDGQPADCELLLVPNDRIVLENFSHGDMPGRVALQNLLGFLLRQTAPFDVSLYDLSITYDIRQLVLSTVLTYLELDGVLQATGPFYSQYRLNLLQPEARILAGFDTKRQKFLATVFDSAVKKRKWWTIDPAKISLEHGFTRDRIVAAIGYLEESGDVEVTLAGLRQGYKPSKKNNDLKVVTAQMVEAFEQRMTRDLQRVETLIQFMTAPRCYPRALAKYFGEDLGRDCGQCSNCRPATPDHPQESNTTDEPFPELSVDDLAILQRVAGKRHAALGSPRQISRYLCGISSPAALRARLNWDQDYGVFAAIPFEDVHIQASQMPQSRLN